MYILPEDLQKRVNFVIDWTGRMAKKYGGIVREITDTKEFEAFSVLYPKCAAEIKRYGYDWGQALCREQYGIMWNYMELPECPTQKDVDRAKRWEEGEIPSWVKETKEEIC